MPTSAYGARASRIHGFRAKFYQRRFAGARALSLQLVQFCRKILLGGDNLTRNWSNGFMSHPLRHREVISAKAASSFRVASIRLPRRHEKNP
jgi:hypothetical protein